jgi:Domain of unknown function (DUF4214)
LIDNGTYARDQAASQFFESAEFGQRGLFIIKVYSAVLGRMPEYAGFRYWVSVLNSGVDPLAVVGGFIGSPEYQQRFGNPDNGGFVTLMYQNVLGRAPDPQGLAFWTNELNTGLQTRTTLMYSFIISAEFDNNIRNPAYALLLYLGFLARDPDPGGYDYWLGVLRQGIPVPTVIASFVYSPEYRSRF